MSKWTGTIIGGGIGWALGGPLGALIGAYIGSVMGQQGSKRIGSSHPYSDSTSAQSAQTRSGDFAVALLSLFAHVSKADQRVLSSEVAYVKQFLIEKFGRRNAQDLMYIYKQILNQDFDLNQVVRQIKTQMDYYSRLELIHILFGIAQADNHIDTREINVINDIAFQLGLSERDLNSIKSIFIKTENQAYKMLNVNPDDDIDKIKKAYRNLAVKYHPDKVANLGPELQELAEEKFKAINDAYQTIRKEKGF